MAQFNHLSELRDKYSSYMAFCWKQGRLCENTYPETSKGWFQVGEYYRKQLELVQNQLTEEMAKW